MTKDEELMYANKYRSVSLKLGVVLMIVICLFGILCISVGIFLAIYTKTIIIIVVGSIMTVFGLFDIILGIKFKYYTKERISKISDKEACFRYCKIHGYNKK